MEFEFDKEIDLLLRQTAQGKAVATLNPKSEIQNPKSVHLDADEISAFAENALPEKARLNYVLHFADCERCRKFLSNLIALNSATQSEIIHAEEPKLLTAIAPEIPWYRKIFAAPTLAYTMGGLILLFAGFGVFTVLQNNSRNAEVSSTYEKQTGGKGMASDGDASVQEMPSNQMPANTAMNSAASSNTMANASNSVSSVAPSVMANSNAAAVRREAEPNLEEARKDDKSLSDRSKQQETESSPITATPAPPPPPAKQSDNIFESDDQKENQPPSGSQSGIAQTQPAQNKPQIMPDTRNIQRAPSPVAKEQKAEDKEDATKLSAKRKTAETTNVGGKTFKRANNVWVDAAYRGQPTINVSRGTNEYKKLDSGLRGIVENLGGTVIVVWKEKAFKIQ